jgi:CRP-like cAMP-binding protein
VRANKFSSTFYKELHDAAKSIVKRKGRILFHTGQPVRGAFLVRSGRVKMTLDHSRLYPSRSLGRGSIIGLPATFSGEPYSLTAKAECDCTLDFIPRARLLDLLRRKPKLGFPLVRMLGEEISQMRKAVTLSSDRISANGTKIAALPARHRTYQGGARHDEHRP